MAFWSRLSLDCFRHFMMQSKQNVCRQFSRIPNRCFWASVCSRTTSKQIVHDFWALRCRAKEYSISRSKFAEHSYNKYTNGSARQPMNPYTHLFMGRSLHWIVRVQNLALTICAHISMTKLAFITQRTGSRHRILTHLHILITLMGSGRECIRVYSLGVGSWSFPGL